MFLTPPRYDAAAMPTPPDPVAMLLQTMAITDQHAKTKMELERAKIAKQLEELKYGHYPEDRQETLTDMRHKRDLANKIEERAVKDSESTRALHDIQTKLAPKQLERQESRDDRYAEHMRNMDLTRQDVVNVNREKLAKQGELAGPLLEAHDIMAKMGEIVRAPGISDRDKGEAILKLAEKARGIAAMSPAYFSGINKSLQAALGEFMSTCDDLEMQARLRGAIGIQPTRSSQSGSRDKLKK